LAQCFISLSCAFRIPYRNIQHSFLRVYFKKKSVLWPYVSYCPCNCFLFAQSVDTAEQISKAKSTVNIGSKYLDL
jgi:hypothetical protein